MNCSDDPVPCLEPDCESEDCRAFTEALESAQKITVPDVQWPIPGVYSGTIPFIGSLRNSDEDEEGS